MNSFEERLKGLKPRGLSPGFEAKMEKKLRRADLGRRILPFRRMVAIAAALALLCAGGIVYQRMSLSAPDDVVTLETEDAETGKRSFVYNRTQGRGTLISKDDRFIVHMEFDRLGRRVLVKTPDGKIIFDDSLGIAQVPRRMPKEAVELLKNLDAVVKQMGK